MVLVCFEILWGSILAFVWSFWAPLRCFRYFGTFGRRHREVANNKIKRFAKSNIKSFIFLNLCKQTWFWSLSFSGMRIYIVFRTYVGRHETSETTQTIVVLYTSSNSTVVQVGTDSIYLTNSCWQDLQNTSSLRDLCCIWHWQWAGSNKSYCLLVLTVCRFLICVSTPICSL